MNAKLVLGTAGLNQLLPLAVGRWIVELLLLLLLLSVSHVRAVATHDGKDERAAKRSRTDRNVLSDDRASSSGANGKPEHLEKSAAYLICKLLRLRGSDCGRGSSVSLRLVTH